MAKLEEAEILLYSPKTPDLDALIPNMKNLRFIQSLMAVLIICHGV